MRVNPEAMIAQQLTIKQQHVRLTQVILTDETDRHNALVHERHWLLHPSEKQLALQGNLFVIENLLAGSGQILLKQAPLPHARPTHVQDAKVVDLGLVAHDSGFEINLFNEADGPSYPWAVIPYEGGYLGRTRALHAWQQQQRPTTPSHTQPRFLSNTWGDRSRDSRVEQSFIEKEIEAGQRLGVEVLQIDDGWQRGITSNSALAQTHGGIWEGYWAQDPHFWEPHPSRFPNGLTPVVQKARDAGMQIGLWFAPDAADAYKNWRKDAACILNLYQQLGIIHFKIDGVRTDSLLAYQNLQRFFDRVQEASMDNVVFDLDVTAQTRPGYFGALRVGPLFVENRYTDWHNYWPHQTLRNLWQLARWVDPRRLRMEFLNHERNTEKYPDDPLSPAQYTPDCLFATVMFSNPLGWFESSNLPATYFERIPSLVNLWKQHRARIFSGTILPVGDAPDGVAWTGIASLGASGEEGYLLVFRELNPRAQHMLEIPGPLHADFDCTVLGGDGEIAFHRNIAHVYIGKQFGYLFVRFWQR